MQADLTSESTARDVLRSALTGAVQRVLDNEKVARASEDPEGVHQVRVGCRRMRSELRTFKDLVEPTWAGRLRDELRWLASRLGATRDLDVLRDSLQAHVERLGLDEGSAAPGALALLRRLDGERAEAATGVPELFDSARYHALAGHLGQAAAAPVTRPEADQPALAVLPGLAGDTYRTLRAAVVAAGSQPSDEQLHRLRIKVKRARYAVDVAAPVVGRDAKRSAKQLRKLQDVLGELHDCVVAQTWLYAAAEAGASAPEAAAIDALGAALRSRADSLRVSWRGRWQKLDRDSVQPWMR